MARDYYEVLGVQRGADAAEIKSAFRKQAMEHHPDRNGGCEDASGRFKEINEAYSVLSDANKRAAYDRFGHAGVNGMGGGPGGGFGRAGGAQFHDVNDIFSEVFGDVFGDMFGQGARRGGQGPVRGGDIRHDLTITLEQAYTGAEVEITAPTTITCDTCDGTGAKTGTQPVTCTGCGGAGRVRAANGFFAVERTCPRCGGAGRMVADPCFKCHGQGQVRKERTLQVRIPAGVDDGARIRLSGEGDAGLRGGPRGDLYIFLAVQQHELFERDGLDLLVSVPAPMTVAALGGDVEVPCLSIKPDGADCKTTISIPEGSQTGKTIRLKGRGMASLNGRQRGDLVVELYVETPTHLTAEQKALMRQLAESCGEKQHPKNAGFLRKAKRFWSDLTGDGAEA